MDRVLSVHLAAAAALAEAQVAALFVPRHDGGLELKAQRELDQAGWDVTHVAWSAHHRALRQGQVVRVGPAVVWPLKAEGQLVAVCYLDQTRPGFPEEHETQHGHVLAERVRSLGRPNPIGPYVASVASPEAEQRRQLEVVLRQVAGNVAAAARVLGVNRDTVYERAARFALNVDDFRPAPPRARRLLGEA
jgi:hypothetical protein